MKRILARVMTTLCLATLVMSCNSQEKIFASKNILTRNITIGSYDQIEVNGGLNVIFSQSSENCNTLTIEASDNIIDLIECSVNNNKLTEKKKNKIRLQLGEKGKAVITTCSPTIKQLLLNGSGTIKVDNNITCDKMQLQINGSGDIKGNDISSYGNINLSINGSGDIDLNDMKGTEVAIGINGSGDIKINSITANNTSTQVNGSGEIAIEQSNSNTLSTSLNGSGDIEVNEISCKEVDSNLQGSGEITLSGNTQSAFFTLKSKGSIKAKGLQSQDVEATVSGSGKITCNGTLKVTTSINGSGNISYKGEPQNLVVLSEKQPDKL